ncbi:MAG: hypothetical protein ACRC45_06415 [Cetobacterium sp.]
MNDRNVSIYDIVKLGYDNNIDTIKANEVKITDRELIVNLETPELIIKVKNKLYRIKLEEVL